MLVFKKKDSLLFITIVAICLVTAGCWDRREIQERNFVLAVAIDKAELPMQETGGGEDEKTAQHESFVQPHGSKKYRLSLQLLRIGASGGEGDEKGKTYVISNTGESVFEMVRDMLGQTSKSLWFEHIQAIVISEAVIKESKLGQILDFFIRDAEMRWRIKVYVTPGEARKVIEFIPQNKEAGGLFLGSIVRLHPRSLHIAGARTDMGYVTQSLDNHSSTGIPVIELAGKNLKITGLAFFRDGQFKGYVDEYTVAGIKLIRGTEKSGIITFPCPVHERKMMAFEIFRHSTRFLPHVTENQLYFTLDVEMLGNLAEAQGCQKEHNPMDAEELKKMEQAAAKAVEEYVTHTWYIQQQMGEDLTAAENKVKAYEPELWQAVKEHWNEKIKEVPLVVSVNITIRNIGEHR